MAKSIDRQTLEHIVTGNLEELEKHEHRARHAGKSDETNLHCSPDALKTMLIIAEKLGWHGEQLCYNNSGDIPFDDKENVVGFGTVVFFEP